MGGVCVPSPHSFWALRQACLLPSVLPLPHLRSKDEQNALTAQRRQSTQGLGLRSQ